jgi:hypothetical protein
MSGGRALGAGGLMRASKAMRLAFVVIPDNSSISKMIHHVLVRKQEVRLTESAVGPR